MPCTCWPARSSAASLRCSVSPASMLRTILAKSARRSQASRRRSASRRPRRTTSRTPFRYHQAVPQGAAPRSVGRMAAEAAAARASATAEVRAVHAPPALPSGLRLTGCGVARVTATASSTVRGASPPPPMARSTSPTGSTTASSASTRRERPGEMGQPGHQPTVNSALLPECRRCSRRNGLCCR